MNIRHLREENRNRITNIRNMCTNIIEVPSAAPVTDAVNP